MHAYQKPQNALWHPQVHCHIAGCARATFQSQYDRWFYCQDGPRAPRPQRCTTVGVHWCVAIRQYSSARGLGPRNHTRAERARRHRDSLERHGHGAKQQHHTRGARCPSSWGCNGSTPSEQYQGSHLRPVHERGPGSGHTLPGYPRGARIYVSAQRWPRWWPCVFGTKHTAGVARGSTAWRRPGERRGRKGRYRARRAGCGPRRCSTTRWRCSTRRASPST